MVAIPEALGARVAGSTSVDVSCARRDSVVALPDSIVPYIEAVEITNDPLVVGTAPLWTP